MERWKPVHLPQFSGLYSVSDQGRVRRDRGGRGAIAMTVLCPKAARSYRQVVLRNSGAVKYAYVHQLVCWAFRGPPPGPLGRRPGQWHTDHVDFDPQNNRLENLRWRKFEHNRQRSSRGVPKRPEVRAQMWRHRTRLTEDDVREIRARLARRESSASIARRFDVGPSCVWSIKSGRHFRGVGL